MRESSDVTPPSGPLQSGPYAGLSYRSAKRFITRQFEAADLPFAEDDSLDLVLGLTGLSKTEYALRGHDLATGEQLADLRAATERRLTGEPVDRILGWRDFYGRRFGIANVLSPRGDTEVLLLSALDAIRDVRAPQLLELGTGSGALAISLLCERPDATVLATDVSDPALTTARSNAETHGVGERITLLQSDWFNAVPSQTFHAILSNPPYIDGLAMKCLPSEVADHDPALALSGGSDGLDAYRQIIPQAQDFLGPNGWLGLEIGYDQGDAVTAMMQQRGYIDVGARVDPAGHDRVIHGRKQS